MNKIITINLGGQAIKIEEDAFEALKPYIRQIEQTFAHTENGKEIINDIESRIAEMLIEIISKKVAASLEDVEYVKKVMGNPGEFDQSNDQDNKNSNVPNDTIRKRLYRDTDNKLLGGVCSGISNYFNIDPFVIRIIWVGLVLFFGSGILLYLIMWVIVPEAVTAAQKLEMRGEAPTLDNIINRVKNEAEKVEQNLRSKHFGQRISDFFKSLSPIILMLLRIIALGFALLALVSLSVLLIGLIVGTNSFIVNDNGISMNDIPNIFESQWEFTTLKTLIALFFGIPLFIILSALLKFGFNSQVNYRPVRRMLGWVWVSTIPFVIYFVILGLGNFRSNETITTEKTLTMNTPLKIEASFGDDYLFCNRINIRIIPSDDSLLHIITTQSASAQTSAKARVMAEKNGADFSYSGSDLTLKTSDFYQKTGLFRNQEIEFIVKVPSGKKFTIDPSIAKSGANVEGTNINYYATDPKEKIDELLFLKNELFCPSCPDSMPYGSSGLHDFNNFDKIEVEGWIEVEIRNGSRFNIQKSGPANIISHLDIDQRYDVLNISMERGYFHLKTKPKVIITMPQLKRITLSGAAECKSASFGGNEIELKCSGASTLEMDIEYDQAKVDLSGASHINLSGHAKNIQFEASGASEINANHLVMDIVWINFSGASEIFLGPSQSISGEVSGASEIKYVGNPALKIEKSGLSEIRQTDK